MSRQLSIACLTVALALGLCSCAPASATTDSAPAPISLTDGAGHKVMLEEPPKNLSLDHPKVRDARDALFGAWEGNWIGYNFAHDLSLPGAESGPVPFLMYPEAEIAGRRRDPLSPDSFSYTITARELT